MFHGDSLTSDVQAFDTESFNFRPDHISEYDMLAEFADTFAGIEFDAEAIRQSAMADMPEDMVTVTVDKPVTVNADGTPKRRGGGRPKGSKNKNGYKMVNRGYTPERKYLA